MKDPQWQKIFHAQSGLASAAAVSVVLDVDIDRILEVTAELF
jgi:hypothetical protein